MMFFSGINLMAGAIVLSLLLAFILRSLHVFAKLSVAIDSFRKFSHKHFKLSYTLLMLILERKLLLKIIFLFSFFITIISALFLVGGGGAALTLLSVALGCLILFMAMFHMGVLTFLWGLKDALEDSVFQLASVLIAVPFYTNLIPGIIGLLALLISQLFSAKISIISLFSVWGQIAGFFTANLAAWLLVGWEAGLLQEEWKS